jgi:hypothetical protein
MPEENRREKLAKAGDKGDTYASNLGMVHRQKAAMSNLEFFFVDEASMLPGRVFNLIDTKLRELKQALWRSPWWHAIRCGHCLYH